jgi:hypothetical protein
MTQSASTMRAVSVSFKGKKNGRSKKGEEDKEQTRNKN